MIVRRALGYCVLLLIGAALGFIARTLFVPVPSDPVGSEVRALRRSIALVTVREQAPRAGAAAEEQYGTATAVLKNDAGTVFMTAAHVVEHAKRIALRTDNGTVCRGKVVRADHTRDIALISTDCRNVPPRTFTSNEPPTAGEAIAILGFPIPDGFADLHLEIEPSVYSGRIASVRRGALELAVPITAGESGGPIFRTSDGALIGIVEARFDDERAIGFGVPASDFQLWLRNAQ